MKKKLTINTLALGNLKQRRKQYTIMIIGIILAMVFSSSVLFLTSAIFDSTKELKNERLGKQEIIWSCTTEENVQGAKDQNIIGEYGYGHIIGSISSTDENYYDMASIGWLDDKAMELANPLLIEGTMPTKENEIAIESLMLSKMGISARVGDTITLNFYVQNGTTTLDEATQREYKLVGILKNKINTITFTSGIDEDKIPSAFVCKDTLVEPGGKENLVCYANFKSGGTSRANFQKWEKYLDGVGYKNTDRAYAITSDKDVKYTNDNDAYDMQGTVIFAIIIISVLMLASCMSIVNAFNSNLKERKKQIGMLRAVGTTKRQIIKIFGREALIIGLITTPISCLISFFVVKGIVGIMGDGYVFKPHLWCFAGAIGFSIISVMLSALIPLVSASRITPIQAIRNIDTNRKMKTKKIKSKKEFTVSKLLSQRSLTFGKGKQVAVSLILAIAIIGSGFAFSWYTYQSNNYFSIESDYEMHLMSDSWYTLGVNFKNKNNGFSELDKQTALLNQYLTDGVGVKNGNVNLIVPFDTSDYRKEISDRFDRNWYKNETEITSENYEETYFHTLRSNPDDKELAKILGTNNSFSCQFSSLDSDYLESLNSKVYDGKINIDKINSGEEIILVAPKNVYLYFDEGKYGGLMKSYDENDVNGRIIFSDDCDFHAGDEIEIAVITADKPTDEEGTNDDHTIIPNNVTVQRKMVKIGAIIDGFDGQFNLWGGFGVLTSHSAMNNYLPHLRYKELQFNLNTKCTPDVDKSVMETLTSITDNVDQADVMSNYGYQQEQRETINKLLFAMLSIIVLVFAISLSIINNTITASIRNSKQKIGTLRAVGADEKELVKSYIYQLLSMLLWGTGFGLAGFGIGYLWLLLVHKSNGTTMEFTFNSLVSIIFVIVVFVACSLNLWSKVRKEMQNSIVENIREL